MSWSDSAPGGGGLPRLSWPLGQVCGVRVYVELATVLLPVLVLALGWRAGIASWPMGWIWLLALIAGILGTILIHELGHVVGARHLGMRSDAVVLHPLGGVALLRDTPRTPGEAAVVAAAGPVVHPLLTGTLIAAYAALGGEVSAWQLLPTLSDPVLAHELAVGAWGLAWLRAMIWLQATLFWLNLIPALPLDGGQLLFSALWTTTRDRRRARLAALGCSMVVLAGVIGVALWSRLLVLALLAGYLFWTAWTEREQLRAIRSDMAADWMVDGVGGQPWDADAARGFTLPSFAREDTGQAAALAPPAAPRRPRYAGPLRRLINRWKARRAVAQVEREQAMEIRLDALLAKIAEVGKEGLSAEELRFLERASARKREQQARDAGSDG